MITGEARRWRAVLRALPLCYRVRGLPWLTVTLTTLVVVVALLERVAGAAGPVATVTAESAALPWPLWLARLPGSMVAPTAMLPFGGAVAQVALITGIAELRLGWRRVLTVGLGGHLLATASGRLLALLPATAPLGLPRPVATGLDTGPSAFVTAVGLAAAVAAGLQLTALVVICAFGAEAALLPTLAAREHLLVLALAVLAGLRWARAARDPALAHPWPGGAGAIPDSALVTADRAGAVRLQRLLRPRQAGLALAVLLAVGAWHSWHPVTQLPGDTSVDNPVVVTANGTRLVAERVVNRGSLPVTVDQRSLARSGAFLARDAGCRARHRTGRLWEATWVCLPVDSPGVRLSYHVLGVVQTFVLHPHRRASHLRLVVSTVNPTGF